MDEIFFADRVIKDYIRSKSRSDKEWSLWNRRDMYYVETKYMNIAIGSYCSIYGIVYLQVFYTDCKTSTNKIICEAFNTNNNTYLVTNKIISLKKFRINSIKNILRRSDDEYDDNDNLIYDIQDFCLCTKNIRSNIINDTIRIKIGATKGYYSIKNKNNNDILWDTVDIEVNYNNKYFMIKWNKPLAMYIRDKFITLNDDIAMYLVWNGIDLITGTTRWNKMSNFIDYRCYKYDRPEVINKDYLNLEPMGTILISTGFSYIYRDIHQVERYHEEYCSLTNAFAFIIVRRNNAIRYIQRQLRKCLSDPIYVLCRNRLIDEFKDLKSIK